MAKYTNSPYVCKKQLTSKCSARIYPISKITIHHAAGVISMESLLNYLATTSREVSANYVLGQGKLGLNVEEKYRAWTSSNRENDQRAVTIEVANSTSSPTWKISDADLKMLIKWAADVCKRNGIKKLYYDGTPNGTLTFHEMFVSTNCPGPYIKKKAKYICKEVNKILNGKSTSATKVSKAKPKTYKVITPLFGYSSAKNALADEKRKRKVEVGTYYIYKQSGNAINVTKAAGKAGAWIDKTKNVKPTKKKSIKVIAQEVLDGKWGNGDERKAKLEAAGYNYSKVQKQVNKLLK